MAWNSQDSNPICHNNMLPLSSNAKSCFFQCAHGVKMIYLDTDKWDYSITTGRYRNIFLGETKAETQKMIDSGEYILIDLN